MTASSHVGCAPATKNVAGATFIRLEAFYPSEPKSPDASGQRFAVLYLSLIEDLEITDTVFRTIALMATFADGEGKCYPSQALLARTRRVSERSVREHIAIAEARGYLEKLARRRRGSQIYRLVRPPRPEAGLPAKASKTGSGASALVLRPEARVPQRPEARLPVPKGNRTIEQEGGDHTAAKTLIPNDFELDQESKRAVSDKLQEFGIAATTRDFTYQRDKFVNWCRSNAIRSADFQAEFRLRFVPNIKPFDHSPPTGSRRCRSRI